MFSHEFRTLIVLDMQTAQIWSVLVTATWRNEQWTELTMNIFQSNYPLKTIYPESFDKIKNNIPGYAWKEV